MKFCPKCGTQLSEGVKFCPICGSAVAAPAAPETATKKKSGINWKVLTILLIVGALIIGAGAAVIVDIVDDGEFNLFGLLDSDTSTDDDDDEENEDDETDPTGTTGPAAPVVNADPKAFKVGAMTITLDTRFKEQAASETVTYLVNEADQVICTVMCMGEIQSITTVDQMAATLKTQLSSSGANGNVYQNQGITYLVFTIDGGTGFMAVYLSDGIFWTVQFSCETADYAGFEQQFMNFAKSVKFAPVQKETRYCEYCEQDVVWQSWTSRDSLPSQAGHYRLENDVTISQEYTWANLGVMCLDLNGKTVTQTTVGQRIANIRKCVFNLIDSSLEGTGRIRPANAPETENSVIMKYWWAVGFTCDKETEFNIYGGTIDCSGLTVGKYGGCIVMDNGILNIYGGKLIGGNTVAPGSGGSALVIMSPAYCNMYGGEIIGGNVQSEYYNPSKPNGKGGGGALRVVGTMHIYGGTIVGGTTNKCGGCMYISGKVYVFDGALITGGTAGEEGDTIYIQKDGQLILGNNVEEGVEIVGEIYDANKVS